MATISAVRQALADCGTGLGFNAQARVSGSVVPPAWLVTPGDPVITYHDTTDGGTTMRFSVLVLVRFADPESAQDELDGYLDADAATSAKAAIEADPTLDGLVAWVHVAAAGGYDTYGFNNVDYLGARLDVEVGT